MSKVLFNITGCGYIGKKVASQLQQLHHHVQCFVASDASLDACKVQGLNAQQFDLDEPGLALSEKTIVSFNQSVIAYFAPPPHKGLADTRMENFLAVLNQQQLRPQKIVLISTTGVYGNCHGEWIDETREVNPQADRAHRRLSAEQQLQIYCNKQKIDFIIFRVPGIYALDKLPVKRITSGEPIVCAEDSGYTNRIHADDLTAFCVEALTQSVESGIYNCCDGNPSTMNDYFMRVAEAMSLPRPAEISFQQAQNELSAGMLSYLAESKRISNKKLREYFKTEFKYPDLTAGLKMNSE